MSLMKIYWVLFSSCLTTSCEASWILNSAGNTAHLLFLKVSTVWNGRISLLKASPPCTNWGLSSPFSILPRSERLPPFSSLGWVWSCCLCHLPMCEPCCCQSLTGAAWFKWGHYYSDISSLGNNCLIELLNHFTSFPSTVSSSLF